MLQLHIEGTRFVDTLGREVFLRGINLSGDSKLPKCPNVPSHEKTNFWKVDGISFSGRPFAIEDADIHLARIASWGFNVVRFVITWEAVEHAGPGKYDDDYIDYVLMVLRKCGDHKLYVLMDPHQDVWSRYSGGSGAPFWTFVAAGMDPRNFQPSEAAIVHNLSSDPVSFPRMIWATNYDRMAAATMFTLFFAGAYFAPKARINGQNVQDFLQSHFINAMAYCSQRIRDADDLQDNVVIGWETMNEPSQAWIGNCDLSAIHPDQQLRKGTCPTPFQAMVTASGYRQTVQVYEFGAMGARKKGTTIIDPAGTSIWLQTDDLDRKYGLRRDACWPLGQCLWELHDIWSSADLVLKLPEYFKIGPDNRELDSAGFLQTFWLPHFRDFKHAIRSTHSHAIIFCQPPVLKIPPVFSREDQKDTQIVYAPHYYDGLTLLNKRWNTWYNVDVLGMLRGRYSSPLLALRLGLSAIRNCLRDQLIAIRKEGLENMGIYPCFFTEIGIPFDMDSKRAYTNGDYSSQIGALDANFYALEGAHVHYTMWHYSPLNTHQWGDFWNGEDLSFYSRSDENEDNLAESHGHDGRRNLPSAALAATLGQLLNATIDENTTRALAAFLRPAPLMSTGEISSYSFDMKAKTFRIELRVQMLANADKNFSVIFVPSLHFPQPNIISSEGRIEMDPATSLLSWWHDAQSIGQSHSLTITQRRSQ